MDVLHLGVVRLAQSTYDVARLVINGRDLVDLVAAFERGFAGELTGKYEPLPANDLVAPSRHLLGKPERLYQYAEGRVALLGCECGEAGCWPFVARIDLSDDRVTWHDRSTASAAVELRRVRSIRVRSGCLRGGAPPASTSLPLRQN